MNIYKNLRLVAIIVLLSASGAKAMDSGQNPLPAPFGKPETALAFAIDQGCLTYLREGGSLEAYVERYARPITDDGVRTQKIYGGHVTVREDGRGGCYIRVKRGNGASLRDTALETLNYKGFKLEAFADYTPYVKTRDWAYLQEIYCWRNGADVYNILISSSAIKRDVTLQATIFKDKDSAAASKGLCLS
jgi:hypothetical protein